MTKIIDRAGKGSDINATEHDANFSTFAGKNQSITGATHTIDVDDQGETIEYNRGTSIAVTLPSIASVTGSNIHTDDFTVTLKNIGAGVVTITRGSTDTLDNGDTSVALLQYESVTLQTDSSLTKWNILAHGGNNSLGITATKEEINATCDGSTSDSGITVASGDLLPINDAGTMKQTDVDDLDTYFSQTTKTLTNKTLTTPAITNPTGLDSNDVGLGNVDDTSDATKNSASATLTNKTLTAPVVNGLVTGNSPKLLLNTKVIDIGDWNMDIISSVNVAHGLTLSKIRSISALIRSDDGSAYTDSYYDDGSSTGGTRGLAVNSTIIAIYRKSGGYFDNGNFDSTSYNRGWIIIQYID